MRQTGAVLVRGHVGIDNPTADNVSGGMQYPISFNRPGLTPPLTAQQESA
jgi:hypothetical protein